MGAQPHDLDLAALKSGDITGINKKQIRTFSDTLTLKEMSVSVKNIQVQSLYC